MGALPDARNAEICARHGVSLLIMHSVGTPKVPHRDQSWPDVMTAIRGFFREKIALAESAGLDREALVLDPGIDFAKQTADNLAIYRNLADLHEFDRPLLAPISRKTVIDDVLARPDPAERDAGTIACAAAAIRRGAQILRVHHVAAAWQTARVLDVIRNDPT
jgi:dihydropteroate synthase